MFVVLVMISGFYFRDLVCEGVVSDVVFLFSVVYVFFNRAFLFRYRVSSIIELLDM